MSFVIDGTNGLTFPNSSTQTIAASSGPAFSAYASATTSISIGTYTKVGLQTKEFDTNNNFDATTNYRFTPTVAGYYQINGGFALSANQTRTIALIYKNGSAYKQSADTTGVSISGACVSSIIYFNGITDYVELYAFCSGSTTIYGASGATQYTYFNGSLVRAA